jgi:mannose-6-phosphate isomerase-like protein (cupin superfamily)
MGYTTASTDDVDSVVPEEWGGMWFLRGALDCENFGITLLELEPGGKGKPHDHAPDGQEEVYFVLEGRLDVALDDETVSLAANEAIRVDPGQHRQLHNRGEVRNRVVIVGSP